MYEKTTQGHIEAIAGCMFSGKSEELIRRLRRAVIARQNVQVFKPAADDRVEGVASRDNRSLDAVSVDSSHEMRKLIRWGIDVVGVDEAQFFDDGLSDLVTEMADSGMRVIVAGLDLDFRRQPFGPMATIMAQADYVHKLHAICMRCGQPALYSQRIAGGSETVQVGDSESYEARCRKCYNLDDPQSRIDWGQRNGE